MGFDGIITAYSTETFERVVAPLIKDGSPSKIKHALQQVCPDSDLDEEARELLDTEDSAGLLINLFSESCAQRDNQIFIGRNVDLSTLRSWSKRLDKSGSLALAIQAWEESPLSLDSESLEVSVRIATRKQLEAIWNTACTAQPDQQISLAEEIKEFFRRGQTDPGPRQFEGERCVQLVIGYIGWLLKNSNLGLAWSLDELPSLRGLPNPPVEQKAEPLWFKQAHEQIEKAALPVATKFITVKIDGKDQDGLLAVFKQWYPWRQKTSNLTHDGCYVTREPQIYSYCFRTLSLWEQLTRMFGAEPSARPEYRIGVCNRHDCPACAAAKMIFDQWVQEKDIQQDNS